ncbi:MAG: hypothetical protein B1H03_04165 [Planctomycetales bacterium 4484_113]|nr:MAG: hypothetical protein B1H03_04165 [Planctomycetales bacterium 4484_113]
MSLNFQALTLGEAELYIDDQQMGIATDVAITKTVERMPVETVEDGEFAVQHLVPMRRAFTLSLRMKEIAPPALAYFLNGGAASAIAGGQNAVTEYLRLFANFPTLLKYVPATSPIVRSADGSITYAEGVDYSLDMPNRRMSLLPDSSISPGELLEVGYSHVFPNSREIALAAQTPATAQVELLHRYPDGESVLSIVLRKVELDASGVFSVEPEELASVPLAGRCLADPSFPSSPFGYLRVYGTTMSQMGVRQ